MMSDIAWLIYILIAIILFYQIGKRALRPFWDDWKAVEERIRLKRYQRQLELEALELIQKERLEEWEEK